MAAGLGFTTFATGDVLTAANVNGYLMQGVWVFADATARDAAVTSPQEGNMCYLKSTDAVQYYSGSAWVAVGGSSGGMTLIQETTASALSSLSFSSISGSYKQLMLVWTGIRHSATGSQFAIRLNNDSGSNYHINGFQGQGNTANSSGTDQTHLGGLSDAGNTIYAFGESCTFNGKAQDPMGTMIIDNYASSTKAKNVRWCTGYYDNSAGRYMSLNTTSFYNSTTAITSIDIVRITGTATFTNQNNTSIRLYGVS